MDEKRFRTSVVSDPFFYRNMFNPRRPHTPDEFTLEMKVDVERLRMETTPSQPVVDMGSEKPGALRRSPAIGTGQRNPEYRELRRQQIRNHFSLLKPVWMVSCI